MSNTLNLGDGNWATKEDSLLGYNSENNNYKPLPFDFSRASSATRVNKDGLIETVGSGEPRIDFKDDTKGSLLLEPQRSNLITYSEDFSQWSLAGGSSISSNQSISPDGTLNADNVSSGEVYVSGVGSSGNTYTFSCYYKGNAGETFIQNVYDGSNHNRFTRTFNGQWQRFSITVTLTNSGIFYLVDDRTGGNSLSFSAWGAQVEQGSYATSYIPTSGSAVTRFADVCNNDFSVISTVANTNTVVLKFIPMGFDVDFAELLRFSDGTNEIALEGFSTNNYDMYGSGLTSSGMVDGALSLDAGSINTISFSYSGTSLRFSHNGSTINTVAPTGNLPTITEVSHSVGGLSPIKILDLRVYNDFKTQEELNTLTI